jgi:hypothetical protein
MRGRTKEGISAFFAFSAVKFLSSLFWLRLCRAGLFAANSSFLLAIRDLRGPSTLNPEALKKLNLRN